MADSSSNLNLLTPGQGSKETTANALFDAMSPGSLFGRNAVTTAALTWGYYGGKMMVGGVVTSIANGTVALSASQTNYIEVDNAGAVSTNTTGFTSGRIPLYTVITGAATVSSYTDQRTPGLGGGAQSTSGSNATPSTPTSGATYYVDNNYGIDMPSWVTSDGTVIPLEFPSWLWRKRYLVQQAGGTAPLAVGFTLATSGSLQAGGAIASTSFFTNFPRSIYSTGTGANAVASARGISSDIWRGSAASRGGFFASFLWSHEISQSADRLMVGIFDSSGGYTGATDPSALTDAVLVGWDAADTVLQIMHNDASGTCTKVSLGANFPAHTQTTDVYRAIFYAKPNASNIYYYVKRLNTGHVATGSLTSNLPTNTTRLSAQMIANNAATGADVRFNPLAMYVATPY